MRSGTFKRSCLALIVVVCTSVHPCSAQRIAFTWDDLPAHSALPPNESRLRIIQAIIHAMQAEHLPPAYGFINGIGMKREPGTEAVLLAWRAAGLPLGNHTWSHINLDDHTASEFESEIQKNEPQLEALMGAEDWRWFRFPFLAEGKDADKRDQIRAYLAAHRYRVAGVTMSFGDYAWNEPYARCVAKHDEAAISGLEARYLEAADNALTYARRMAKQRYGREIPYVLLMHVGAFDARMLSRLIALYQRRGASFVTLEQAQADPVYRSDMDLNLPADPTALKAKATTPKLGISLSPTPPDFSALCR